MFLVVLRRWNALYKKKPGFRCQEKIIQPNQQKSTNEKIKYYWNETSTGSPNFHLLVAGGSVAVDRVTSPLFAKHHLPLKKGAKHYLPLKTGSRQIGPR